MSLCSATTFAQSPSSQQREAITVEGIVRSSAGEPVGRASVFLEEKDHAGPLETKTKSDGTFVFSPERAGVYTVKAEKAGMRGGATDALILSAGEKKHIELRLETLGLEHNAPPSGGSPSSSSHASSGAMEFQDESNFTVAGVTDWSNVGLHGSDTRARTSEALAKETVALKSVESSGNVPGAPGTGLKSSRDSSTPDAYALAPSYRDKGDFARARVELQKSLANADSAEGHRLLGDLDERLGDPLEAVREYERAARLEPSEQNYFAWGTELLLHNAVRPAIEVFTKGSSAHPDSARMLAGLGAALYASGSFDDAALKLCAASDLRPADTAPYLFLGEMEKAAPAPLPCSEQKLARFAHDQPENALANYYYAMSLYKRDRGSGNLAALQKPETLLRKAVTLDPRFAEAYVQLGILYSARGAFEQAVQAYEKAIEVRPELGEAHYRLSLAYKRMGEEAKAHQEFQAYEQAEKTETAAVEEGRRGLRQFLVILKDQPPNSSPR